MNVCCHLASQPGSGAVQRTLEIVPGRLVERLRGHHRDEESSTVRSRLHGADRHVTQTLVHRIAKRKAHDLLDLGAQLPQLSVLPV